MTASLQFNVVHKTKLYYNKYKFKASCRLFGARFCYYVKNITDFRNKINNVRDQAWHKNVKFDNIDYGNIENFIDFRKNYSKKLLIRMQADKVEVYTNDEKIFSEINFSETELKYHKIELGVQGTIPFKSAPKFNFRTYFKSTRLQPSLVSDLESFDQRISEGFYKASFSRTLSKKIKTGELRPGRYIHGSYFIDYDSESLSTVLHMMFPGSLGSTFKLVQSP